MHGNNRNIIVFFYLFTFVHPLQDTRATRVNGYLLTRNIFQIVGGCMQYPVFSQVVTRLSTERIDITSVDKRELVISFDCKRAQGKRKGKERRAYYEDR